MRRAIKNQYLSYPLRDQQGFTLLEVLIAIVILSLGLLGLSAMTISTIRGLAFSEDMTTATNLAQEKMEALKGAGYTGVSDGISIEDYDTIAGFNQFKRQVQIIADQPLANTKTAIVSVSWKRLNGGQPHQVTLQTIISQSHAQ